MLSELLHSLPGAAEAFEAPKRFTFPFAYTPHPWAAKAAEEVVAHVHNYMDVHPESELHERGKMFGVLVVKSDQRVGYLAAFSAMLDGTYQHEGFVPPIVDISRSNGYFKQEELRISAMPLGAPRKERSQALQRWLFAEYKMLNGQGEVRNLLQLFAHEKPIISEEDYFNRNSGSATPLSVNMGNMPPSGAGECCAPKLLQYAYQHELQPLCMAEFWIGAPTTTEIREEGRYYPACSSKCKPILRHMLQGLTLDADPMHASVERLLSETSTLYEDDCLLVVNKPAGLKSEALAENLSSHAFYPAHRLDQDTSGILVLARNMEVYKALQKQFVRRDVEKRYEAVIESLPVGKPAAGVVSLPLLPNPFDRPRQMVNMEHGKAAITRYEIKEQRANGTCLVDFFPATGRTHQLRVHAAHQDGLAAPIVGDRLYGTPAQRLMLHAAELTFTHPVSGEPMHFVCPSGFA